MPRGFPGRRRRSFDFTLAVVLLYVHRRNIAYGYLRIRHGRILYSYNKVGTVVLSPEAVGSGFFYGTNNNNDIVLGEKYPGNKTKNAVLRAT